MKRLFLSSIVLPVFTFILMILKVSNLISWDFQFILIPLYVWLIMLGIAFIIWLYKEEKDND